MKTNLTAEELLRYTIVRIPDKNPKSELFSAWIQATGEDIASRIGNEPVELRGEAHLEILFPIFVRVRKQAREIAYRRNDQSPATVVFSLFDESAIVRPKDVLLPIVWNKSELEAFEQEQRDDVNSSIDIPLDAWWRDAKGTNEAERTLLSRLYAVNPEKERVNISGEAPAALALLVLNWFLMGGGEILYEGSEISWNT